MPQLIHLPRGVHLLYTEEDCVYEGDQWNLHPVKQVHTNSHLSYARVNVPSINVHQIVSQHIEKFKSSMVDLQDLARVKTITLKPLREDSTDRVNLEEFLDCNFIGFSSNDTRPEHVVPPPRQNVLMFERSICGEIYMYI